MNIENPVQLKAYLVKKGWLPEAEPLVSENLTGGVSCRTILVKRRDQPDFVIKQARAKLQVEEDWFSDPARIHVEAAAMRALQALTPPESVPHLLFEDRDHHLLAMEAVLQPHHNWKSLLLKGKIDLNHVEQFARLLAGIHRHSLHNESHRREFADRHFFETLRLEPYYAFTAGQAPEAATFLQQLIDDCRKVSLSLVHGDFSPKNILVYKDRLVLLDHEVMHFGDGAFDIGFSMTHLLSKARHVKGCKTAFLEVANRYWSVYRKHFPVDDAWEQRAVRHTIACLLARVRGKSPLEYLTGEERNSQEAFCIKMIEALPSGMPELISRLQ